MLSCAAWGEESWIRTDSAKKNLWKDFRLISIKLVKFYNIVPAETHQVSDGAVGLLEIFSVHPNDLVDDALRDAADARVLGEVVADDVAQLRRHRDVDVAAWVRWQDLLEALSERSRINLEPENM